jgi:hypothetical protein
MANTTPNESEIYREIVRQNPGDEAEVNRLVGLMYSSGELELRWTGQKVLVSDGGDVIIYEDVHLINTVLVQHWLEYADDPDATIWYRVTRDGDVATGDGFWIRADDDMFHALSDEEW